MLTRLEFCQSLFYLKTIENAQRDTRRRSEESDRNLFNAIDIVQITL